MIIQQVENNVYITDIDRFDLAQTLECGQCFRWKSDSEGVYTGIVGEEIQRIYQTETELVFFETTADKVENFWVRYFDLERDYEAIANHLSELEPKLKIAQKYAQGIRILNQEPWEVLCSFIISQNNNIPRIQGIISRMCSIFGEEICGGKGYTFPSAGTIAELEAHDLADLRAGFRAKYIIDAARKYAGGEIAKDELYIIEIDKARSELMKIFGVGPKVADCVLLFGFGRLEAFPQDVWIKRILSEEFPNGTSLTTDKYAGIAQQYLFHWARTARNKEKI